VIALELTWNFFKLVKVMLEVFLRRTDMPHFPDDDAIQAIAQTKLAEADALPPGSEKYRLEKEAGSYKILAEARHWFAGELKPPR
jgi:hypothetical protein